MTTTINEYPSSERINIILYPEVYTPSPIGWKHKCINMFKFFTKSSSFKDDGIEFATNQIFFPVHDADFWIDEVTIQQRENESNQTHVTYIHT